MILKLDLSSETPIYLQIRNQIVLGIGQGQLRAGEGLPTVRQLAEDIGVNTMTVNKAYSLLKGEGYIEIDRRKGAVVKPRSSPGGLDEDFKQRLSLLAAEAAAKGVPREQFLEACREAAAVMNPKGVE
ncbi:MAG TPA: GntR family transcriptional regulator [Candidatus Merdivicinus intestinigallinarum]|nr:GntR family transcriptional regulator [Candidatus Merdivicinus intestinigallinarum]